MKIKKDGFVCQVAYHKFGEFNPFRKSILSDIPKTTSVCVLFWNFVFGIFRLFGFYLFTMSMATVTPVLFFIFFMFGRRCLPVEFFVFMILQKEVPKHILDDDNPIPQIKRWPNIYGYRILPIYILPILGVVWVVNNAESIFTQARLALLHSDYLQTIALVMLISTFTIVGFKKLLKTEFWQLVKGFVRAKKEKICPIVEIIN